VYDLIREEAVRNRCLIAGTLAGGVILSILSWFTAAILPPRFKQFRDSHAVVEVVRANVSGNDIYNAPQGLFVSVSLRPDLANRIQNFGPRIVGQFAIEFAVAFGLALLLLATPIRAPLSAAWFFALSGLVAGIETRFPHWNWAGFPTSDLLAGTGYLAGNWFITGLVLARIRQKLDATI
jgi:hypothetical protein